MKNGDVELIEPNGIETFLYSPQTNKPTNKQKEKAEGWSIVTTLCTY